MIDSATLKAWLLYLVQDDHFGITRLTSDVEHESPIADDLWHTEISNVTRCHFMICSKDGNAEFVTYPIRTEN